MIVYITAFALTLLLCIGADVLTSYTCKHSVSKSFQSIYALRYTCLWLAPLPIIFITCFRYGVGYDYFRTYITDYDLFKVGEPVHSDFGFNLFYWICQTLAPNTPQLLFIITGFITIICIYWAAYIYTGHVSLSILLFFIDDSYFRSISMIAQYLSISILLFSFSLLFSNMKKNKSIIIPLLLLLFASCIHSSAILVSITIILLYFLKNISPYKLFYISLALPILALILRKPLTSLSLSIISKTRFGGYIYSVFADHESTSILFVELFITLTMFVIVGLNLPHCSIHTISSLTLQTLALSCALLQGVPLMFRIAFYFAGFHIISLPKIINTIPNIFKRIIVVTIITIFLTTWLILYPIAGNYDAPLPYSFSFDTTHLYY
ncbi:EpsG family [Bifidobacterium pseudolongum subsp. globosum]|uniref:EpsG family protein n=1 Tax=Bifidobacterium pseudolongum TaxID=1694 RepID=UPI00102247B7|nr:EpsG family [Bifidobacterium pseudolongum subsp. globosum]